MLAFAALMFAPSSCRPRWEPGSLSRIQAVDLASGSRRVVTDRQELDQVAATLARAEVISPSNHTWTHRVLLEEDRGSWLYDARAGDFAMLSITQRPTYHLNPGDKDRFDEILGVR